MDGSSELVEEVAQSKESLKEKKSSCLQICQDAGYSMPAV